MAEVAVPRQLFEEILQLIDGLLATGAGLRARIVQCIMPTGGVCPNAKKNEPNQLSERDFSAPVR
jgi:hypothetical protein